MAKVGSPLPADSAPSMCVMAPVVDVPPVVVEDVRSAPVFEFLAPVPGVTYAAPALVIQDVAPAPAVTCAEQAPVDEYSAPAPAVSCAALVPVVEHVAPAPAAFSEAPPRVVEFCAPTPAVSQAALASAANYVAPAPVDGYEERNQRLRMGNRAKPCALAADGIMLTSSGSSTPGKTAAIAVGSNSVTSP